MLKSPVDIQQLFLDLNQHNEGESSEYHDTKMVCKDESIFSNRLLLTLAFPVLEKTLTLLQNVVEPVIILPDFTSGEVRGDLLAFLSGTRNDKLLKDDKFTPKKEMDIKSEISEKSFDIEPCIICNSVSFLNI